MERSLFPPLLIVLLFHVSSNDGTTTPASVTTTASSSKTTGSTLDQFNEMVTMVMPTFETVTSPPTLFTPPTSFGSLFGLPKGWNPIPDGLYQRGFNATDIWFADPDLPYNGGIERHWNTNNETYQYLGGPYNSATAMIYRDVLDLIVDAEAIIRDIIELIIAVVRLVQCSTVAIWSDEKIQRFERPQTNLFARHMSIFSKRERVDDRLWDATAEEPEVIRCIKREGDQITKVLWYILKAFYYIVKVPARGVALIIHVIVAIVRVFDPTAAFALGIDHHSCYVVCQLLSEKAAVLCQETCGGVSNDSVTTHRYF